MKPRRISAVALLLLVVAATATGGNRVVLPDAVTPEHYRIDFTPDIAALAFTGTVEIDVNVRQVTNTAGQTYVLAIARIRYQAQVRATRLPEIDRYLAKQ